MAHSSILKRIGFLGLIGYYRHFVAQYGNICDIPIPGGPLTTRQPAEYKWMSGYPTPPQKIGQSLLSMGSSTRIQYLHETCLKQSNIIIRIQLWIKTASWAHATISIKTYQLYPIVLRVQMFYSYTTHIKI